MAGELLVATKGLQTLVRAASSPGITTTFRANGRQARYTVFRQERTTTTGYAPAATGASSTCIDSIVRQRGPGCRGTPKQAFGLQGQSVVGGASGAACRTAHHSTCGWQEVARTNRTTATLSRKSQQTIPRAYYTALRVMTRRCSYGSYHCKKPTD
jgi:hypothetical protein